MLNSSEYITDHLFLLEFLVEKLKIDTKGLLQDVSSKSELCMSLSFFDKGPLELCEEECNPNYDPEGYKVVQNGKSCLFALDPVTLEQAFQNFEIHTNFYKKFDKNVLPNRLKIGEAFISISKEFQKVLGNLEKHENSGPISESNIFSATIKGTRIGGDSLIGELSIYIRISGFGKIIVSEINTVVPESEAEERSIIQANNCDCKTKLGENGEYGSQTAHRIKGGADVVQGERGEMCNSECPGPASCADIMAKKKRKCVSFPYDSNEDDIDYCPKPPCNSSKSSPARSCRPSNCGKSPCNPPYPCYYPSCVPPPGGFPVCKPPPPDCTCAAPRLFDYPSCGCTRGATNLADPCECLKMCPAKRGHPCVEKQVLSLTPGDDPTTPFAFKISGCGAKANQNISVVPPVTTRPDGMKVTEISDPLKDVFTLRIGQKDETDYRKPRLELELITRKPSPPNVSVRTQFDPCDYDPENKLCSSQHGSRPASAGTRKGKKNKKGKGKGKGKKKGKKR